VGQKVGHGVKMSKLTELKIFQSQGDILMETVSFLGLREVNLEIGCTGSLSMEI